MQGSNNRMLARRRSVARRVAAVFTGHPAVAAILVFGSVASGQIDERSDVDMMVICHQEIPPLPERNALLTRIGTGWQQQEGTQDNPLFVSYDQDGTVDGILVTVHYQTKAWVDLVLSDVINKGMLATPQMPFRAFTLPALLQRGWLLQDPDGLIKHWRERISIFPPMLKANLLQHFIPILQENVEELVANAERKLGPRVFIFRLNWAIDALTSILFALNDMYDPADRRMERGILPMLSNVPDNFLPRLTDVLQGPFDDEGALFRASLFAQIAQDVLRLAEADVQS